LISSLASIDPNLSLLAGFVSPGACFQAKFIKNPADDSASSKTLYVPAPQLPA
jgi:hypothetical protein